MRLAYYSLQIFFISTFLVSFFCQLLRDKLPSSSVIVDLFASPFNSVMLYIIYSEAILIDASHLELILSQCIYPLSLGSTVFIPNNTSYFKDYYWYSFTTFLLVSLRLVYLFFFLPSFYFQPFVSLFQGVSLFKQHLLRFSFLIQFIFYLEHLVYLR